MAVFDYPVQEATKLRTEKSCFATSPTKKKILPTANILHYQSPGVFPKGLCTQGKAYMKCPSLDIQYTGSRLSCTWSGKTRTMTWMHMKKRKSQLAMSISFFRLPIYFIVVFLFFFGLFSSAGSSSPTPLSSASPLSDS